MPSPFAVLGVAETADDAAVKKAYLQQVREHPPERDSERFQAIPMLATDSGLGAIDMVLGMDYLGSRRLWLSYARRQVLIMAQPRRQP